MKIITIILTGIGLIALIIAIIYPTVMKWLIRENEPPDCQDELIEKLRYPWRIPVIMLSLILIIFMQSFTIIPTGHSGVRTVFGQVKDTSARKGFNWKIPFVENIEIICTKQQDKKMEGQVWSETKARTTIYYEDVIVTYQINDRKTSWIYANVADYEDNLLTGNIVSSAIKTSSKELNDVDATNRGKIEPLVAKNLQASLNEKYGEKIIAINKVTIVGAEFEKSYNEALANKQKAILEQERQQTENQTKINKATAEAEAKQIEAQGAKTANDLLKQSLTDQILMEKLLDKWNGNLPTVTGSNGAMFDLSDLLKSDKNKKKDEK